MLPLQHKIHILHFTGNSHEDFLHIQFVVFSCLFVLFFFSLPFMKWSDASDFSKDAHFHSIVYKSSPASFLRAFIMRKPNASDFRSWLTYAEWLMARRRQGSFSWMSEFGTEEWQIFQRKRKSKHFRQCRKCVEVRHPALDKKKMKRKYFVTCINRDVWIDFL